MLCHAVPSPATTQGSSPNPCGLAEHPFLSRSHRLLHLAIYLSIALLAVGVGYESTARVLSLSPSVWSTEYGVAVCVAKGTSLDDSCRRFSPFSARQSCVRAVTTHARDFGTLSAETPPYHTRLQRSRHMRPRDDLIKPLGYRRGLKNAQSLEKQPRGHARRITRRLGHHMSPSQMRFETLTKNHKSPMGSLLQLAKLQVRYR